MNEEHAGRSAVAHFSSGLVVVAFIGALSWYAHSHAMFRNLEMVNLDVLFLSQAKPPESDRIALVAITEDDYRDKELFNGSSPLSQEEVIKLIEACARSGAVVIGIDLDTSDWPEENRAKAAAAAANAAPQGTIPRLVWAVGGYSGNAAGDPASPITSNKGAPEWHLDPLQGLKEPACQGVPASMPDEYGIVRGYVPQVTGEQGGRNVTVGNLAEVMKTLFADPSHKCAPPSYSFAPEERSTDEEHLVNYRGGGVSYPLVSAKTVLGAAASSAWQTSNPLQKRIVIIGGEYREARDKYVTPIGYLDGVEILALTITSLENRIKSPTPKRFLAIDLTLGVLLLTATWFLHRGWVLLLSFVLIPFAAILLSVQQFAHSGYFISFVPIMTGILCHRLVEFTWEHSKKYREMAHEIAELKSARPAQSVSVPAERDAPPTASSAPPDPAPHP